MYELYNISERGCYVIYVIHITVYVIHITVWPDDFAPPATPHRMLDPLHATPALGRGIANHGDLARLRRVLGSLRGGEPVLIAALGASVTSDYAGIDGDAQAQHPGVCTAALRQCGRGCRWSGWLQDTVELVREEVPHARLQAVNCGLPGNPLSYAAHCLESHVPLAADLVLVDAATIRSSPPAVEAILRRLLSLPRQPAVLLLHFFHWCLTNRGCGGPRGVDPWSHGHMAANWLAGARMERELTELAAYYALPALSLRAAHYHAALNASRGGRRHAAQLTKDGLHPTRRGNKRIASLLASFLLAAAPRAAPAAPSPLELASRLFGRWTAAARPPAPPARAAAPLTFPLPPPLHYASGRPRGGEPARVAEQCFGWGGGHEAAPGLVGTKTLPQPLPDPSPGPSPLPGPTPGPGPSPGASS